MWRVKHRAPNGALALVDSFVYKHLVPPGPGAILSNTLLPHYQQLIDKENRSPI
jgi:hypothetical protein